MRLIAKVSRISHAKFHCDILDIQGYASVIFSTQCRCCNKNFPSTWFSAYKGTILKSLQFVLAVFAAANNVMILMEQKNVGTLGCLAFCVTATSQLMREVE